jgi:hypothetical protein
MSASAAPAASASRLRSKVENEPAIAHEHRIDARAPPVAAIALGTTDEPVPVGLISARAANSVITLTMRSRAAKRYTAAMDAPMLASGAGGPLICAEG